MVARVAFALLALLGPALRVSAQALTVTAAGDVLKVHAPGLSFLKGEALARLKEGRSLRVELALAALSAPAKAPVATVRQIFALSYDLWEERFAVTAVGSRSRSISHLTPASAESWCVDQMAVPLAPLGARGVQQFWIRLEYRILDDDSQPNREEGAGYTLEGLIDILSRRRKAESSAHAIEGGPFQLPPRGQGSSRPR